MRKATVLAAVVVVALVGTLLAGCGGGNGGAVPDTINGTWFYAAYDTANNFMGSGMLQVNADTSVTTLQGDITFTGNANSAGGMILTGTQDSNTYNVAATLNIDDLGTGTWVESQNGVQSATGTVNLWRANGASYTGTYTITVAGSVTGTITANVDANGVITGTATVNALASPINGVVTGPGQLAFSWGGINSEANYLGTGTLTATGGGGNWVTPAASGLSGTWTATVVTP